MQAMTIETRQAPGGRWPAQCPCFPFGAKGASTDQGIRQRLPFRCNKTKTSRTAGWRSSWSPGRRHRQSLWQPKTNFSQDKCTRCSPSKWPIVGALPAHYLGRGPGPRSINRTSHHRVEASRNRSITEREKRLNSPKQFTAPAQEQPLARLFSLCTVHHQPLRQSTTPHTGVGYYTTMVA